MRWLLPAGENHVHRLAFCQQLDVIGHIIKCLRADAVTDTNADHLQRVQTIHVGHRQFVDAIDHGGVAGGHRVKPAAAPRASSGGAEFAAHAVQQLGDLGILRGQRPFAHARRVGLHHSHHAVHAMRRNARAGASAAGGGIGRSHEGVGAMIDVEKSALGAFEQDMVAAPRGLVQQDDRVGDKRFQSVSGGPVGGVDSIE